MGISVWQVMIVLLIVVLLFGTKKLRGMGGDLGEAVKGFKNGIKDIQQEKVESIEQTQGSAIEPRDNKALNADELENSSSTN